MNNMQLWQQQLMYKQLQEIQRQQQLQQLDEGARQLGGLNQLSAVAKPATGNHSPAALNDVPVNDVYNFTRPNSFVGGTPNVPPNPQMCTAGNMNWMHSAPMHSFANGVFISNDQSEALRSMGFISQQNNQTFQGIPVSDTSSINQYPHILGIANNRHDSMTKADPTNSEKASYLCKSLQSDEQWAVQGFLQGKTSATTQNSQGKHLFGNSQVQVLGNNAMAGNFQEKNNLQHSAQFQESHCRYEQDDSSSNLQGKPVSQRGSSTLDPIEQKILFGTDDDNWGFSFGGSLISETGVDMHGHFSENDCSGAYPSLNSGSWSALMQEAVQSSNSDKGLQEEWSGLGLQKSEQLNAKLPIATNDNGKHPAYWDNKNLHSASLLTSTPFPLFNDDNANLRSSITPSNQHFFKSAHEDENRILTKAPHVSSSFQGASNNDFHQNPNQSQLAEDGLQAQIPSTSGVWDAQAIEQHNKGPGDIQFKSQNMEGGWDNQPNLPLPNISIQSGNRPNGWSTSYPMEFRGSNTSNYHENDDNLWKTGEEHVHLNNGLQPNKSYIGNPKTQEDSFLAGRHAAVGPWVNSEGDRDVERKLNQPSRRPQTREPSARTTGENLGDNHENGTVHGRMVSGEDYVGNTAKELMLAGNNRYPSLSGSQKSSIQSVQHPVGSKVLQNPLGDLRTVGPSFPPNYQLGLQNISNSVFQELNNEQKLVGKTQFSGHSVSNESMIASKGTAVRAEEMHSRKNAPIYASNRSFDGSASQYSHNEMIRQESNNMLELLHKVDQSRNGNSASQSDLPVQSVADISIAHPHLRLAPPSQRQSLTNYAPIPSKSANDINNMQLDHAVGYQDQPQASGAASAQLVSPLNEAFKTENQDKISSLSGQKPREHQDANDHYILNSSAAASNFQLQEQQQQLMQQHIASVKDHLLHQQLQQRQHQHLSDMVSHEASDQSVKFSIGNQANESGHDKNASVGKQPRDTHNEAVPGQSVQMSLPTLGGRFPTSGVDSLGATPIPVGLQLSSGVRDDREPTIAGFPQTTRSAQQLPAMETGSTSQSSISGMSQQVAFSNMLHNVWKNLSARQSQAGISPQMLTPSILQSIINNGRNKSLWGMPKAGDQVNKEGCATPEVGSGAVTSEKQENPIQGNPSNLIVGKKVNASDSSSSAPHGEEGDIKSPLDGGPSASVSSLVHQHQQDVSKAKFGQDPAFSSPSLPPLSSMVPSSSGVGISGCMSKPSDALQQNYSLLHQVQAMKASDYDANRMVRNIPNAVGSNATQMNYNRDQRFDGHQNRVFRTPDGKVGMASQVSFPSDAKVLAFVSNGADERNPSTSRFGQNDLQTNMRPLSTGSTANMMGGSERTQISPQMAPSWFERYGAYQNDRLVAVHDAQRIEKAAIQQYSSQKIPARMDDNSLVEQRDSGQIGSYRPGALGSKTASSELSPSLLPPGFMDHDMIVRSKKRKTTRDLPWHKVVVGPQSPLCISMAELDWAQAVNRLIKVDDEAEIMEDGSLVPQSRRRLIRTTQLMHQLLTAVPAVMFKGEATSRYEGVTFSVARSTLADACSLICSSKSDSHVCLENENVTSRKLKTSEVVDDTLAKLTENFICRSKKLEMDFSRLDKKTSMLDVRLECQELERFSIVNRLGKFHGRAHSDGVENSSNPENAHHRIFLQRYITALPVPGNLPEGVLCLSL